MTYESLVKSIESLPPLSNTTFLIQELYANGAGNIDIIKLVKIIESDALLAANVLKMINAPIYGFSKQIASVSQAVTLFGTQEIFGLVLHYAIHEKIKANTRIYGVSATTFNDICHLQSALLMQWYSKIDPRQAQFLTSLALIMESGKLVLAQEITKSNYVKEFKKGYEACKNTSEYEDSLLGTTSYYISGLLFEHWNLEPIYVDVLKYIDYEKDDISPKVISYLDTLNVIKTAVNTKDILTKKSVLLACREVNDMGLNADYFAEVALRVKRNYLFSLKNR